MAPNIVSLVTEVTKTVPVILKRPSRFRRARRWIGWSLAALFALVAGDVVIGTPKASEIRNIGNTPQATTVYDVNNQQVYTLFKERRIDVPLTDVSQNVVAAVLAIEDQRFYQHDGIDLWRVGGAFLANIRSGGISQGGSTITMQLARKSFLTDDRTFRRKLKETFLAQRIERGFTKDQILEMYLNKVYFGDGYYGVEAAARGYFAKTAKTLSVEEAALLAGLVKAPSAYAPTSHLDRALARRNVVINQMADAGFISAADAATLVKTPVKLQNGFPHERTGQYFKNYLTKVLVDKFGWERVSKGGFKVYATIDAKMQQAADAEVDKGLEQAEKLPGFKHPHRGDKGVLKAGTLPAYLQGALLAMDPSTGEVRAMVGGRSYDESSLNRAVQTERQAGSAFKPFVYAAAIESGYSPATLISGLDDAVMTQQGAWLPDDHKSEASSMTVRTALRTSSNRAAVQVLRAVGIPTAVSFSDRFGVHAPAVPSMVLGTGDVSLMSMTAAYGAFANGGWLRSPVFVRRVEDADGRVIYSEQSQASHAISEQTAFLMANMLSDVINAGTGYRIRQVGFTAPAAGKTGTTNDFKDAWFIGFTPTLVTGVWVGFDEPQKIAPNGFAAELAAPIWGKFMKAVANSKDAGWLKPPPGIVAVEICKLSGALPTDGCRRAQAFDADGNPTEKSYVGTEYFRAGTEPTTVCPIHGEGPSLFDRFRTIIGIGGGTAAHLPAPPPPGLPQLERPHGPVAAPAPAADVAPAAAVRHTPAPPEKKKGFWGKLKSAITGPDRPTPTPKPKSGAGGS